MTPIRNRSDAEEFWYDRKMDESLNRWFASYDEAVRSLETYGGYLLPYRHQFVVVEQAAIRALGLDPRDPDWEAVGRNCVQPAESEAFARLKQKRETYRKGRHER